MEKNHITNFIKWVQKIAVSKLQIFFRIANNLNQPPLSLLKLPTKIKLPNFTLNFYTHPHKTTPSFKTIPLVSATLQG